MPLFGSPPSRRVAVTILLAAVWATANLANLQQILAARVRVLEEREERTRELLTALDDLEKKATAHNASLSEARPLARELTAAALDLKKRIGRVSEGQERSTFLRGQTSRSGRRRPSVGRRVHSRHPAQHRLVSSNQDA